MRGGRAGMIASTINKKNHNLTPYSKKQSELRKYGLEEVPKRPIGHETSKKYRPTSAAHQQVPVNFENNNADGFYDHHAEILAEKRDMEQKDKIAQLNELESIRRETREGIEQDIQFNDEFDAIERGLKNHHPARGDYQLKRNLYKSEAEQAGEYAGINIQEINEHRLIFRKIPYVIWMCGIFILLSGLYLIYHLTLGHFGVLFEGYREGHWWQYFIAIMIVFFGVMFVHAGKVNTVIFDKNSGILSKVKTSIFCKKDQTDWAIDQIKNVRVFKRGHDGVQVMTIHYEVQVDFADVPSQTVLESKEQDKAIKQMVQIKSFIGLPIGKHDLKYINQSTSKYDRRKHYQY